MIFWARYQTASSMKCAALIAWSMTSAENLQQQLSGNEVADFLACGLQQFAVVSNSRLINKGKS
jgi:hypothetical protein